MHRLHVQSGARVLVQATARVAQQAEPSEQAVQKQLRQAPMRTHRGGTRLLPARRVGCRDGARGRGILGLRRSPAHSRQRVRQRLRQRARPLHAVEYSARARRWRSRWALLTERQAYESNVANDGGTRRVARCIRDAYCEVCERHRGRARHPYRQWSHRLPHQRQMSMRHNHAHARSQR